MNNILQILLEGIESLDTDLLSAMDDFAVLNEITLTESPDVFRYYEPIIVTLVCKVYDTPSLHGVFTADISGVRECFLDLLAADTKIKDQS